MTMRKRCMLLVAACTVLSLQCCRAFTTSLLWQNNQLTTFTDSIHRFQALIYMPDGEVVHDDEGDQRVIQEGSTALLEYLNERDFRAPLAVLTAAHAHVDISTIQQVSATNVSPRNVEIQALCAVDGENCVKVQVTVDFPIVCSDESEVIATLNQLHQEASAKLEQTKKQKEQREEFNVRPVPTVVEKKTEITLEQVKRKSYQTQRALLAARLERQVKTRAGNEQAREIASAKFKEEMKVEAETRRNQKIESQKAQRRTDETKRASHAKQQALLAARLQREEAIRATIRQEKEETERVKRAMDNARRQPKPKQEEEKLAARYGAIDDIGERAFAILVDLGMVTVSPDPKSPDYNDSHDDEFVE